jgi:hypothetical protein
MLPGNRSGGQAVVYSLIAANKKEEGGADEEE